MASTPGGVAHHNYHHVLATPKVIIPPGENPCTTHSAAQSHLVWFTEGLTQQIPVLWQQLRVALGDVPFPLLGQVDLSCEKWTRKPIHHNISPFMERTARPDGRKPRS